MAFPLQLCWLGARPCQDKTGQHTETRRESEARKGLRRVRRRQGSQVQGSAAVHGPELAELKVNTLELSPEGLGRAPKLVLSPSWSRGVPWSTGGWKVEENGELKERVEPGPGQSQSETRAEL